jgi:uroporphyrin-III C-methyltransferase
MAEPDDFPAGSVWLVGAGPGDPELLTRKAERLLRAADVVFYDALVGPGVLALPAPRARRVHVGKRCGRHSADQATIGRLIVQAAAGGQRVVRLKGGDPVLFGRATEELAACREAGIQVRICPGITAASAAAADLGLSLTSRGLARRVTFMTAHVRDGEAHNLDWSALVDPQATLAIYMGKGAAGTIAGGLMRAGLAPDTPVALVESVSLPSACRVVTRLDLLPLAAKAALGPGPALILVGECLRPATASQLPVSLRRRVG